MQHFHGKSGYLCPKYRTLGSNILVYQHQRIHLKYQFRGLGEPGTMLEYILRTIILNLENAFK
jgi:hypothetical protein